MKQKINIIFGVCNAHENCCERQPKIILIDSTGCISHRLIRTQKLVIKKTVFIFKKIFFFRFFSYFL
jgi:hypothetical protein